MKWHVIYLTFLLLLARFESIDDFPMILLAFDSSSIAPHTHPLFSILLHIPNSLSKSVNWYSITLLSVFFVSCYYIFTHTLKTQTHLLSRKIVLILCALFTTYLTLRFTYTSVALVATIASVLLFTSSITTTTKGMRKHILAFVLLAVGLLLRDIAVYIFLAIAVPLFLSHWSFNRKRPLLLFTIIVATIMTLHISKGMTYSSNPSWQTFHQFNQSRYVLSDFKIFSYLPYMQDQYLKVGWSLNDYLMYSNYFYDDASIYLSEDIQLLTQPRISLVNMESLINMFFWISYVLIKSFPFLIIITPLYILLYPSLTHKTKAFVAQTFAVTTSIIFLLCFVGKIELRVIVPIYFYLALLPFCLQKNIILKKPTTLLNAQYFFFLFSIISLLYSGKLAYSNFVEHKQAQQYLAPIVSNPQVLTIFWHTSAPVEWIHPLDSYSAYSQGNILWMSWLTRSPYNEAIKKRFGITNVVQDMVNNPNVQMILTDEWKELLQQYYKEHYHQTVSFHIVSTLPNGAQVVRVVQ